jgi:hypothetical protein
MMFDWHQEEPDPIKKLDSIERRDSHVKKNSKNNRIGHEPEQWRKEDG